MEPYFDLGTYTRGTSTASTSAQMWFDRGLVWSYGFHHEEAIRCFERALEHDPGFALAHWGIAYAVGPNYNKQWEAFDPVDLAASLEKACDEVVAARACADRAAPVERALVEAIGSRYQANDPSADLVSWNADYAAAMREVYRAHPDDLDVAALFADALMNLTPWALWDRYTGLPCEGAATLEAKEVLERGLERPGGRAHPGLVHLYVHLMEMSPFPERALPVADELRSLVPDAGHLVHMPTHIDVLCGDYKSTLESNLRAIEVNEKYVAREGRLGFHTLYHAHDRHFAIYGAMFLGRSQVALRVAADLEASLPEELLRIEQPPMADWLEAFIPMRHHVLIRFGMWEDIIALPLPADPELYCTTTAMTHSRRAWRTRRPGGCTKPRRRATRSSPPSRACPSRGTCSTTRPRTSSPWPARCSTASSSTGAANTTRRSSICAGRSRSTTRCRTTSRGAGCSPPAMPTGRCCSSRIGSRRPRPSTPRTWATTRRSRARPGTPETCGACTATTSAWFGWGRPSRRGSWGSSSTSPSPAPTSRSSRRASAG
jgi:tetratricopeptide (TPR) repeat protein